MTMPRRATALLLLALSITLATTATATSAADSSVRDAAACRALGFEADTLDCRRCDELAAFLREKRKTDTADATDGSTAHQQAEAAAAVDADCRACCSDLSALHLAGAGGEQHARVVLEVCTCKFGRYPKVANFVQNHAAKHAMLEIKYINARHPFLIFYDAEGNKKEEVSIASWDEDTIAEFIEAKVAPSAISGDDDAAAASSNNNNAQSTPEPSAPHESDEL